ncbi:MAG: HAD family hydrolase [Acidobacteriia bacterium]|nr:HAD family hydrolase [Terriglobia bacterium]
MLRNSKLPAAIVPRNLSHWKLWYIGLCSPPSGASVPLTTIFFDAGGTLVFPDLALTERQLASRGIVPSDEQRYAAERAAKRQFDKARAEHHSVDSQYWDIYYLRLFRELGMADDAELRASLVAATRKGTNWQQMRPDTREVLARLKWHYRIGLISNSDGSVRRLFELLGLADCFDSFTDSHLCGFEKPDPRIFEAAMASLGATPQQSLYVGDIFSVDFLGAQGVGMRAVLMDVAGAYRDTPYPRVETLAELESHLVGSP